jgi:hypothetical protein
LLDYPKQIWCSPECREAIAIAHHRKNQANREKAVRKAQRAQKRQHARQKREFYDKDIKTRREAAVRAFNAYIRLRDREMPCISCGAEAGTYKLTAGHFITAGSCTALRFDERNVFGQCWWNCNRNKSGNITGYRLGIRKRFGEEEGQKLLDFLEGPQPTINITAEWYKEIEEKYRKKIKQIQENGK